MLSSSSSEMGVSSGDDNCLNCFCLCDVDSELEGELGRFRLSLGIVGNDILLLGVGDCEFMYEDSLARLDVMFLSFAGESSRFRGRLVGRRSYCLVRAVFSWCWMFKISVCRSSLDSRYVRRMRRAIGELRSF